MSHSPTSGTWFHSVAILCALLSSSPGANGQVINGLQTSDARRGVPALRKKVFADRKKYPTVQDAIAAACDGTTPGQVLLPAGLARQSVTMPSNCWLRGAGRRQTTLQATDLQTTSIVIVSGVSNVVVSNLTVDGNRGTNPSASFDGIEIVNASDVTISGAASINVNNANALSINGSSGVRIIDSEFARSGFPLPGASGAGIAVGGITTNVSLTHNRIHDNNLGIFITNPASAGAQLVDVLAEANEIYSNAGDGFSAYANSVGGGKISGIQFIKNESFCNGWPARGAGFSPHCTPGFFQQGVVSGASGVGVDFVTSGLITNFVVSHNRLHDNIFDGFSVDGEITSTVSTSGKEVTWNSGPRFESSWKVGDVVDIGTIGMGYAIESVNGPTSITLATSVGTHPSTLLFGATVGKGTITRNAAWNNGVFLPDAGSNVGVGFYNSFSNGNTYFENTAKRNNLEGFFSHTSSGIHYERDRAYNNNRSKAVGRAYGFTNYDSYGNVYLDVATGDTQRMHTQMGGLKITTHAAHTTVESRWIVGPSSTSIDDSGSSTVYGTAQEPHGRP